MPPQPDDAVRLALDAGAAHAAEAVRICAHSEVQIEVGAFVRAPFAAFPDGAPLSASEEMASTVAGFRGALSGVAVLSLEPDHALRLIGPVRGPDALDAVRDVGGAIARAFAEAMLKEVAPFLEWDRVSLREGNTVGAVLETRAPADTAVLSVELAIEVGGERFPAFVYLLLDSKLLEQLVSSATPSA